MIIVPVIIFIFVLVTIVAAGYGIYQSFAEDEVFSKTGTALWFILPITLNAGLSNNLGSGGAFYLTLIFCISFLLFCLYRPVSSGFKSMMLAGLKVPASFVLFVCIAYVLLVTGYALWSGELKQQGSSGLPISSFVKSIALAIVCIAIISVVRVARSRDSMRLSATFNFRDRADRAGPGFQNAGAREEYSTAGSANHKHSAEDIEEDWWIVLEVARDDSLERCEIAAKTLLKDYHPDRWISSPIRMQKEAERQTRRILVARENFRAEKSSGFNPTEHQEAERAY